MALTLTRWIVAALVGCAALAGWALHDASSPLAAEPINREAELLGRAASARGELSSTLARLRTVAIRDSLATHAPSVAEGSVVTSDHSRSMRWGEQRDIPRLMAEAGATRPTHPLMPIEVAFLYDTASVNVDGVRLQRPLLNLEYMLPASAFNDRCTVVVEMEDLYWGDLPKPQSLLGPCAYYEAFGPPGPAVDRWLRARGWAFGQRNSWNRAEQWRLLVEGRFPGDMRPVADTLAHESLGIGAARCATGDVEQCQKSVLESGPSEFAPVWGAGFMSANGLPTVAGARQRWLGPADDMLLSEMVRTLGPERFAAFWRSDKEPAQAFKDAAGVSIGEWTRDWMQREYGKQTRGPTVNYAGFGLTGIILLVGLVVGVRAVQTRRVG